MRTGFPNGTVVLLTSISCHITVHSDWVSWQCGINGIFSITTWWMHMSTRAVHSSLDSLKENKAENKSRGNLLNLVLFLKLQRSVKAKFFSFVSRCSHVWCRSRRFDCILLVFFRRWGRLVVRDLIKHDALLWLVGFQEFWLVHFDPRCFTQWFAPSAVRCRTAFLLLCFWSWASTLLEFLFHYPCWCCQGEVLYELPLWPYMCSNEGHDQ